MGAQIWHFGGTCGAQIWTASPKEKARAARQADAAQKAKATRAANKAAEEAKAQQEEQEAAALAVYKQRLKEQRKQRTQYTRYLVSVEEVFRDVRVRRVPPGSRKGHHSPPVPSPGGNPVLPGTQRGTGSGRLDCSRHPPQQPQKVLVPHPEIRLPTATSTGGGGFLGGGSTIPMEFGRGSGGNFGPRGRLGQK